MKTNPLPERRHRRASSLIVALVALSLMAGRSAAAEPNAPSGRDTTGALEEFNAICGALMEARVSLERGALSEEEFGDLVLGLFLRADSLAGVVASLPHSSPGPLGLQRGTAFLIDSLRENWIGIAAQNGVSFIEADLALKAAVAWRSSEAEVASNP